MPSSRPSSFPDPSSSSSPIPLLHLTSPSSPPPSSLQIPSHPQLTTSYTRPPASPSQAGHHVHPITDAHKLTRSRPRTFPWSRLQSLLYLSSFYLFIVFIAVLFVASAWGIGQQAWRTRGYRRWDIVILTAAYIALGIIAIIHVWSRLLSIKKILRTMPKPYMPTKQIDVPRKVADHIMIEYSRTAVIAHISQATTAQQEGWGRPGTKWENHHFRTYILNTLPTMKQSLAPQARAPPLSLDPLFEAADNVGDNGAIRLFVNSYARIVDQARFGKREPTETDAAACEKVMEVVLLTLEMKRRRKAGQRVGDG